MSPPASAHKAQRPGLRGMTSDLRNRLLLLLVLPLCLLAVVGVWMDYRSADDAASRHDQRLLRLLPALADSVVARLRVAIASSIMRSGTWHRLGYVVLITLSNGMPV